MAEQTEDDIKREIEVVYSTAYTHLWNAYKAYVDLNAEIDPARVTKSGMAAMVAMITIVGKIAVDLNIPVARITQLTTDAYAEAEKTAPRWG